MRIDHDHETDAAYIYSDSGKAYHHGVELEHWMRIDFSEDGDVFGIEILRVSNHPDVIQDACRIWSALSSGYISESDLR